MQLTTRKERLPYNAKSPGKLEGDHAGHLAGDRFGGSPKLDNIVSQLQKVNQSEYRKVEEQWAKAIKEGKKVAVNVDIKYDGANLRPSKFIIDFMIDGRQFSKSIYN